MVKSISRDCGHQQEIDLYLTIGSPPSRRLRRNPRLGVDCLTATALLFRDRVECFFNRNAGLARHLKHLQAPAEFFSLAKTIHAGLARTWTRRHRSQRSSCFDPVRWRGWANKSCDRLKESVVKPLLLFLNFFHRTTLQNIDRIHRILLRTGVLRYGGGSRSRNRCRIQDYKLLLVRLVRTMGRRPLEDLAKYPAGYARYILDRLVETQNRGCDAEQTTLADNYKKILAESPSLVKRVCHAVPLKDRTIGLLRSGLVPLPRTRFRFHLLTAYLDWFELGTEHLAASIPRVHRSSIAEDQALLLGTRYVSIPRPERAATAAEVRQYLHQLSRADVKGWRLYAEYAGVSPKYTRSGLFLLFFFIDDASSLYHRHHDNGCGVPFHPIRNGQTFLNKIRTAIHNHNAARQLAALAAQGKDAGSVTVRPGLKDMPAELEALRLKTREEMFVAGRELENCLGIRFADSEDIFLRKGTVVLQLSRKTGRIVQCQDMKNRITDASRLFRQRVSELLHLRPEEPEYTPRRVVRLHFILPEGGPDAAGVQG